MALFRWFGGRSAADHETRADGFAADRAWGKAKLEYDRALDKLESLPAPDAAAIARLNDKVRRSRQALADRHIQNGRDLLAAGYLQDAAGLFELALELSEDPATRQRTAALLARTRPTAASEMDAPAVEKEAALPPAADTAEDHFAVLCSMLPADLQDIYSGYGPIFRQGYVALHQGAFARAAERLEQARRSGPENGGYILLELASAYFNLGRIEEARGLLEEFVGHHPEALPGYELLCEIYWEQTDTAAARRLLAGCPQPLKASAAYVVLHGETLRRAAEFDAAERWYAGHLQEHGWNDKIALALAAVHEQSAQTDRALALYARYMGNCRGCGSRTPPEIERKYADLSLATGNLSDEVLEIYLALARKDPANAAEYYLNASRIYAGRGNHDEARRFEDIAEQLRSDSVSSDAHRQNGVK